MSRFRKKTPFMYRWRVDSYLSRWCRTRTLYLHRLRMWSNVDEMPAYLYSLCRDRQTVLVQMRSKDTVSIQMQNIKILLDLQFCCPWTGLTHGPHPWTNRFGHYRWIQAEITISDVSPISNCGCLTLACVLWCFNYRSSGGPPCAGCLWVRKEAEGRGGGSGRREEQTSHPAQACSGSVRKRNGTIFAFLHNPDRAHHITDIMQKGNILPDRALSSLQSRT